VWESNTTDNTASVSVSTSYWCITEPSYFFMTKCTTNNDKHCDVTSEQGSGIHCTCTQSRTLLDKVTDWFLGWSKELYISHKSMPHGIKTFIIVFTSHHWFLC